MMKDIHLTTVYYMRLDRAQFIFFFKFDSKDSTLAQPYSTIRSMLRRQRETRRRANAGNVRLYYPYWQYTNFFIFRFHQLYITSVLQLEIVGMILG